MREVILKIAGRLHCINYFDMTLAERQIANILVDNDFAYFCEGVLIVQI